ncbi:MAG TPA: DUF4872 domain-containing protein, partial [Dehalococcoidia bacterium]|nr:DUF4872 domain-containing protein [Dehalococcoidia bacterium]
DVFFQVEILGAGGLLRGLFAECLDEASTRLGEPALGQAARQYRDLAAKWTDLADTALPDAVAPFREVKRLLRERDRAYRAQGWEASTIIRETSEGLRRIEAGLAQDFPLTDEDARSLRADLRDRLWLIEAAERQAIDGLAGCLGLSVPAAAAR